MALMEKAIDDVYNDFFSLTQTLRLLSEDGDSMATGLLQQVGNIKFLSAVYLLHQVLPLLAHLSKVFQAGSVSFAAIGPAINYTLEALETVSKEKRPLSALQKDLCTDGRLSVCDKFVSVVKIVKHADLLLLEKMPKLAELVQAVKIVQLVKELV